MRGKPKYKQNDRVVIQVKEELRTGRVVVVDACGSYFNTKEPSYDILIRMPEGGEVTYKHIPESSVQSLSEFRRKNLEQKS